MRLSVRTVYAALFLATLTLAGCPLGRGDKKLGEECHSGTDCASVLCSTTCVGPNCPTAGICTTSCMSDADCASSVAKLTCVGAKGDVKGTCSVAPATK